MIVEISFIHISFPQEAVEMVKPIEEAEEAAKMLMQEASQRGSADNITVLFVRFLAASPLASDSEKSSIAGAATDDPNKK